MATLFSELGVGDNDRIFQAVDGQTVVDTLSTYVADIQAEIDAASGAFVGAVTESHTERQYKPGTGEMAETAIGETGPAVRASGSWTVAYPLRNFAEGVVGSDVDLAYMTAAELDRHTQAVTARWANRHRNEIMKALFNNVAGTFSDARHGDLTIQPLANGDAVAYPPIVSGTSEATADHYLVSGYTAANISDTNNPLVTLADKLEDHFGQSEDGGQILVFINRAQRAKIAALTDFVPRGQANIAYGDDTDLALPAGVSLPGRLLGVLDEYGVWIAQWDRAVPANYLLAVHLGTEAPLARRVDPADTGLPRGLHMAGEGGATYAVQGMYYRDRFGYGVRNRLNGAVMELTTDGSYDVPAAYS
jgi:hypothetical protein